jgi:hypothetical protein
MEITKKKITKNMKNIYDMVEKIQECARNRKILTDTSKLIELLINANKCKAEKELKSCQDCSEISNCWVFECLIDNTKSICLMCRIRDNCTKIEKFTVWLNCLF